MNTCSTCRWWGQRPGGETAEDAPLDRLLANLDEAHEMFVAGWDEQRKQANALKGTVRYCGSPKLQFYVMPMAGEAAVVDGSEYSGGLVTTAAFGCTNYEAREAA